MHRFIQYYCIVTGRPSTNPEDVDYVPSIFVFSKPQCSTSILESRRERREKRKQNIIESNHQAQLAKEAKTPKNVGVQAVSSTVSVSQQTEIIMSEKDTQADINSKCTGACSTVNASFLMGNDLKTKFYTGLPKWSLFLHVFSLLSPHVVPSRTDLTLQDELIVVLMKLRLNCAFQDLAFRWRVSPSTISRMFYKWINIMEERMKFLIMWPKQEILKHNMPQVFKDSFPNTIGIIDCSEIFIERPTGFQARAKTYSNYKRHNTIKFLIAVTPCGTISYVSKCWGGRVSDRYLTQQCGFLELLKPGDVILADRGFNIEDDLKFYGAKLEIPAFTRGKKQLSVEEVERSKRLSRVRIHVERVIGLLKMKYKIIEGPLPLSLIKSNIDKNTASIDKIVTVCSALINLSESIVN